jgi:hypothetical protein
MLSPRRLRHWFVARIGWGYSVLRRIWGELGAGFFSRGFMRRKSAGASVEVGVVSPGCDVFVRCGLVRSGGE